MYHYRRPNSVAEPIAGGMVCRRRMRLPGGRSIKMAPPFGLHRQTVAGRLDARCSPTAS